MTIRDMLDAGIVFEGRILVRIYTDEYSYVSCPIAPWESMGSKLKEEVKDMEIFYMFSEYDAHDGHKLVGHKLVIEVGKED